MRFRDSPGVFAGAMLLLLAWACPLFAAAPPPYLIDSRQGWVGQSSSFRFSPPSRWIETTLAGRRIVYRENNRQGQYIELRDVARQRYVRLYAGAIYVYVPQKEHFRKVDEGSWDDFTRKPLDLARNNTHRHHLTSHDQQRSFPRLGTDFEVLGPATASYNCICWSLGANDTWVWPRTFGDRVDLSDFDTLYDDYGFRRMAGLDFSRQKGLEKVVLFAVRRDSGRVEITHASRQMPDGSWSSKLGSLPLIRHLRPDDLVGPTYGQPYAVYVRVRGRGR